MIDLKRLKTNSWFGYCIGTYDGKYRPTAYTIKRAAQKLMRKARTRNGDWFAYYCGKDGEAYKCAIEFNDGDITVYNLGKFKDLGLPIVPRFRKIPDFINQDLPMGVFYRLDERGEIEWNTKKSF